MSILNIQHIVEVRSNLGSKGQVTHTMVDGGPDRGLGVSQAAHFVVPSLLFIKQASHVHCPPDFTKWDKPGLTPTCKYQQSVS